MRCLHPFPAMCVTRSGYACATFKERIPDIAAVRLALAGAFHTESPPEAATSPVRATRGRRAAVALAIGLSGAVVGGLAVWRLTTTPAPIGQAVTRFSIPASTSIAPGGVGAGRHVLAIFTERNAPCLLGRQPAFRARARSAGRSRGDSRHRRSTRTILLSRWSVDWFSPRRTTQAGLGDRRRACRRGSDAEPMGYHLGR